MKVDLMQAIIQISPNGPDVGSEEGTKIIESAIQQWNETKKRRKHPKRILPKDVVEAEKQAVVVEQADASVQTQRMEIDTMTADVCEIYEAEDTIDVVQTIY